MLLFQLAILVASWTTATFASHPSGVHVNLEANFPEVPILSEIIEYLSLEDSHKVFDFLDCISDSSTATFTAKSSEKEIYETSKKILEKCSIIDPHEFYLLDLSLAIHETAPALVSQYEQYRDHVSKDSSVSQSVVYYDGSIYSSVEDLEKALKTPRGSHVSIDLPSSIVYKRSEELNPRRVILFIDPNDMKGVAKFHKFLQNLTSTDIQYEVMHKPSLLTSEKRLGLSGYGVELGLKRTDYLVVNDETNDINKAAYTLSSKDLTDLGLKVAQEVLKSSDKLETLKKINYNFPELASTVSKKELNSKTRLNFADSQKILPPGTNVIFFNGRVIKPQISIFELLDLIRVERKLITELKEIGIQYQTARHLLSHPKIQMMNELSSSNTFDFREEVQEGNPPIHLWLNDIEKDVEYRKWHGSYLAIMQRMRPGTFPQIRRNAFNLLFYIDLTDKSQLSQVISVINTIFDEKIAIRVGIVPMITDSTASKDAAKSFYYSVYSYGSKAGRKILSLLHDKMQENTDVNDSIADSFKDIANSFTRPEINEYERQERQEQKIGDSLDDKKKEKDFLKEAENDFSKSLGTLSLEDLLSSDDFEGIIKRSELWASKFDLGLVPSLFANGNYITLEKLRDYELLLTLDLQKLQQSVFQSKIDELDDPLDILLEDALKHRCNICQQPEKLSQVDSDSLALLKNLPKISVAKPDTQIAIISNYESDIELDLLSVFAKEIETSNPEVIFFNNGANNALSSNYKSLASWSLEKGNEFLKSMEILKGTTYKRARISKKLDFEETQDKIRNKLDLDSSKSYVIVNGLRYGPFDSLSPIVLASIRDIILKEYKTKMLPIKEAMKEIGIKSKNVNIPSLLNFFARNNAELSESDQFSQTTSKRTSTKDIPTTKVEFSKGSEKKAKFEILCALDPLSAEFQPVIAMLTQFYNMDEFYFRVILSPFTSELQTLPIKHFYRYALQGRPVFDDSGVRVPESLEFSGLDASTLFTLKLHEHNSWIVTLKDAKHDMDNILLHSISQKNNEPVRAIYGLDYILLEGHAQDLDSNAPAAGLEVLLKDSKDEMFDGTIVMANLGYFQFKAKPGNFKIELKEGRATEIFDISSVNSLMPNADRKQNVKNFVSIESFRGERVQLELKRKEGHLESSIMPKDDEEYSDALDTHVDNDKLNIFTLASGHLYERFIYIMIQSVLENTSMKVKFWFIENFLSPTFKKFIPYFAKEHGFDYELVTFKWPSWLRKQSEKQREIWGYKILFLDVLFPLNLKKIIFVDADQIVREDLSKLLSEDLNGAPYGYTPMCDSRSEIEGYRFWKQGFWKTHLQDKPYHISALYVVDLQKFRRIMAGDILRQQYEMLSRDPNSLANLDQDLPNYLQPLIPIHSLDQDWLWCETWCSDESLKTAKTIDLCNNPMTKEPKLARARRQIPEWNMYDNKAATFASTLLKSVPEGKLFETIAQSVDDIADKKAIVKDLDHDEL